MNLDLSGKVALVAGGSKGIGKSIAMALAGEGVDIAICARNPSDLAAASEEISAASKRVCLQVRSDLSTVEGCRHFVETAAERFGRIDILVCAANHLSDKGGTLASTPDEDWISHMQLKFFSAVRCAREAVPQMKARKWGRINFIGGMATRVVRMKAMDNGPICAALTNFGKQLAAQVVADGIRVNTIHPDYTRTELFMAFVGREARARGVPLQEVVDELAAKTPIGRLIEPAEIANFATFLSSDLAGAITGQSIAIDGGSAMSVHY
jgi:3-oxoacyl-[acyl-carrier protein] reductase